MTPDAIVASLHALAETVDLEAAPRRSYVRARLSSILAQVGGPIPGYSLVPSVMSVDVTDGRAYSRAMSFLSTRL